MMSAMATVLGSVDSGNLGRILPHEHIFGADGRGWRNLALEQIPSEDILNHHEPLLRELVEKHDCRTLVEVSPWGLRRPQEIEVWRELSRCTGMNIVASTGYYVDKARPPEFAEMSAAKIADGMLREIGEGIEGTGVKAGIIKIAIGEFDTGDRKLCQAAAIAQRVSGAEHYHTHLLSRRATGSARSARGRRRATGTCLYRARRRQRNAAGAAGAGAARLQLAADNLGYHQPTYHRLVAPRSAQVPFAGTRCWLGG